MYKYITTIVFIYMYNYSTQLPQSELFNKAPFSPVCFSSKDFLKKKLTSIPPPEGVGFIPSSINGGQYEKDLEFFGDE